MGGMRGPNNLRLVGFDVWIPEPTGELEPEATSFLEGYLKRRQVQVEDRYIDTADGALARAGYAARLRRERRRAPRRARRPCPSRDQQHRP